MSESQIPFALAMASVSGSAPFVALIFDDGAAVSLHSVRALAVELGLVIPQGTVFDLIEDWERVFPALCALVNALAHSDAAQGHRGDFVAEDLLTMERLLPEARQIFRIGDGPMRSLPTSCRRHGAHGPPRGCRKRRPRHRGLDAGHRTRRNQGKWLGAVFGPRRAGPWPALCACALCRSTDGGRRPSGPNRRTKPKAAIEIIRCPAT